VIVHGLLVERVHHCGYGGPAVCDDLLGDDLDGLEMTPGDERLGPLACEGA